MLRAVFIGDADADIRQDRPDALGILAGNAPAADRETDGVPSAADPAAEAAAEEAGASVLEQPFSRPRPAMPAAPAATFMKLRREMFAMMGSPFFFVLLCLVLLLSRHIDCVFTNDVV